MVAMADTVELLKALADETRLRITSLVLEGGDLCACEVEAILRLNQSNASRHLTRLRQAGVLRAARKGQWVHYAVPGSSDWLPLIEDIVGAARGSIPLLEEDLSRLADYRGSGFSCRTIREWSAAHG